MKDDREPYWRGGVTNQKYTYRGMYDMLEDKPHLWDKHIEEQALGAGIPRKEWTTGASPFGLPYSWRKKEQTKNPWGF